MAPGGVLAAHLAPVILLFLLVVLCALPQLSQSLWTYDRQTLLHIQTVVSSLHDAGQCHFSPWLVRPLPAEILRSTGNASGRKKRRRKRGCRAGVSAKTRRSRIALASRAGDLRLPCLRMICPEVPSVLPRLFLPKSAYCKRGLNLDNLRYLRKDDDCGGTSAPIGNDSVRMVLVNARSLTNKTFILNDFYTSNNLDFLFIVETWMNAVDSTPIVEVTPTMCDFFSSPRGSGQGGGLTILLFKINVLNVDYCHLRPIRVLNHK